MIKSNLSHFRRNFCQPFGFTMLEFLIASVISLLLLTVLLQIYFNIQKVYQKQHAIIQTQESAYSAINQLQTVIENARYIGCAKLTTDFPVHQQNKYLDVANIISGDDRTLTLRGMIYQVNEIISVKQAQKMIVISDAREVKVGERFIIASCREADVLTVARVVQQGEWQYLTFLEPIRGAYDSFSNMGKLAVQHYFTKKTQRRQQNGSEQFALYMMQDGEIARLVDDVEHMELHYIVLEKNVWKELPAAGIRDWSKVRAISIALDIYENKKWYLVAVIL